MNRHQIYGRMKLLEGKATQMLARLTGSPITAARGKGIEIAGRLEQSYGDAMMRISRVLRAPVRS